MTVKEVKDQVLKLLNQYTMAGQPVSELYNNQADYLNRMPSLINDAMMEIATTVRKIPAIIRLSMLPSYDLGKQVRYLMPFDFYQFKSGDVVKTDDGKILHTNQYMMHGQRAIVIPKDEVGDYTITYYRYPCLLDSDTEDGDELDNVPETHFAVPFYVAAFLVDHDDSFLTQTFMNKFADKLQNMLPDITAEVHTAEDAYSFYL